MNWNAVRKRLQKQSFDLLTQRHCLLVLFVSLVVIFVTLVHFGESVTSWSAEKYAAVMSSFSDNVVGQSFRQRLCLPVPIDIVYTWVNGSDPELLQQLRDYKATLLRSAATAPSTTNMSVCAYDNCVFANGIVIDPAIPSKISLKHLGLLYPLFKNARLMLQSVDMVTGHNVSLVLFTSADRAEAALAEKVVVEDKTANIRKLYCTTEKSLRNTVDAENTVIMIGFPDELDNDQLIESFPTEHRSAIVQLAVHKDKGIAVLTMSDNAACNSLLSSKNVSISGKSPTFKAASFVWDLTDYRHSEDISASRFEDNDELRYSLRSVERHASWIRHIFIVTNGQIPSWLNLDDKRVTVVSHSEIFSNTSHLPTFSSPAIESHLHKIPGLSEWFIYMNDDVLFGRDVWPDDFVTASGTQKVYLTWPVPNCNDGCPASWISDGYCDRACNNSQCEWDGGDCNSSTARAQYPFYGLSGGAHSAHLPRSADLHCSQGCANNWIADRYCDQACNVRPCGFDAADCGTGSYSQLHGIALYKEVKHYDAKGTDIIYFNLSTLFSTETDSITSGTFSQDSIVRSASVARKFKVITVVMYSNETERLLNFSLSVDTASGKNFTYNFSVTVDTLRENAVSKSEQATHRNTSSASGDAEAELLDSFRFRSSALRKFPKPKHQTEIHSDVVSRDYFENITRHGIPVAAQSEYISIKKQLENGELTQTGFNLMLNELVKKYPHLTDKGNETEPTASKDQLKATNQSPVSSVHSRGHGRWPALSRNQNTVTQTSFQYTFNREDKIPGRHLNYHQNSEEIPEEDVMKSLDSLQGDQIIPDRSIGFLPWEKLSIFSSLNAPSEKTENSYETNSRAGNRRLLDTYADSLRHVSRVYNRAYGYTARRVPGHMPHMINRGIATAMQKNFAKEWDMTSSHRIRHSEDMQFAFSYYYYLMSEPVNSSIDDLFSEIDTDNSGVLSDRELRILATRIYDLPIDLQTLEGLEMNIINCSQQNMTTFKAKPTSSRREKYYDKRMPQVTLEFVKNCQVIAEAFQKHVKSRTKYEFEIVGEDNIMFKMLNANVSRVVNILDEVRQQPRKFICLNDNIDYEQSSAKTVKVVLRDFYESLFPKPSRFELPRDYRNKFLHVRELHDWWYYRTWLRRFVMGCVLIAVTFTVVSFCSNHVCSVRRRWSRR